MNVSKSMAQCLKGLEDVNTKKKKSTRLKKYSLVDEIRCVIRLTHNFISLGLPYNLEGYIARLSTIKELIKQFCQKILLAFQITL